MATKRHVVHKKRPTAAQWRRQRARLKELRARVRALEGENEDLRDRLDVATRERDLARRANDHLVELGEGRVAYPRQRRSPENYFDAADKHDFVPRQAVRGGSTGL